MKIDRIKYKNICLEVSPICCVMDRSGRGRGYRGEIERGEAVSETVLQLAVRRLADAVELLAERVLAEAVRVLVAVPHMHPRHLQDSKSQTFNPNIKKVHFFVFAYYSNILIANIIIIIIKNY